MTIEKFIPDQLYLDTDTQVVLKAIQPAIGGWVMMMVGMYGNKLWSAYEQDELVLYTPEDQESVISLNRLSKIYYGL